MTEGNKSNPPDLTEGLRTACLSFSLLYGVRNKSDNCVNNEDPILPS